MWARAAAGGTWHYYSEADERSLLCSTPVEPETLAVTTPERPSEFGDPLCYRCWFQLEWNKAIETCANRENRQWLMSAPFHTLDADEPDRLSSLLGVETADRMRVLSTLAETYDHEVACPEKPQASLSEAEKSAVEIEPRQPKFTQPPKRRSTVDPRRRMDHAYVLGTMVMVVIIPLLVILLLSWK